MKIYLWMISLFRRILMKLGGRFVFMEMERERTFAQFDYGCECTVEQPRFADKLDEISHKVDAIMATRKLYLDPALTLDILAMEVGTNRT